MIFDFCYHSFYLFIVFKPRSLCMKRFHVNLMWKITKKNLLLLLLWFFLDLSLLWSYCCNSWQSFTLCRHTINWSKEYLNYGIERKARELRQTSKSLRNIFHVNNEIYLAINAIFCNNTDTAHTTRTAIEVHGMPNSWKIEREKKEEKKDNFNRIAHISIVFSSAQLFGLPFFTNSTVSSRLMPGR